MERTVAERLHGSWRVNRTSLPVAVLLAWALLAAPSDQALAVQLPPEIQADLYEEQLEQRLEERDFEGAQETLDQIRMLRQDHGLEIPDVFYFQYAEVLQQLGLYEAAVEELTRYLTLAGQEGEHYQAALTMLIESRESLEDLLGQAARAGAPEMVVIPAGRFQMGCVSGRSCGDDELPVHEVAVASFALSKYEVTREEYAAFVVATRHTMSADCIGGGYALDDERVLQVTDDGSWRDPGFEQGDGHPVVCVSWEDAQVYVRWLSEQTGQDYRLPSEAEWEYAARAGTTTYYTWGNDDDEMCRYANGPDYSLRAAAGVMMQAALFDFWYNDCGDGVAWTAPVGSYVPNDFGLHDMVGNVSEWVEDCWHENYAGAPSDGTAWTSGGDCGDRVLRGGYWNHFTGHNSADRRGYSTGERYSGFGFRVARTLTP